MDKGQSKKEERPEGIWQQGKPDMKRTLFIAFVVFLTFSSCILFFFVLYRYNGFANYWKNLSGILQPIIFGVVLAYLLNPIMKFIERNVSRYLLKRMKDDNKRPKVVRLIGITGALIFLLGLFALLIAAIVPSVTESITSVATSLPDEINSLIDWVNSIAEGDGRFADILEEVIKRTSEFLETWLSGTVLPQIEKYAASIASSVITSVKFVLNILIGIVISVYVLANKEKFAGQAKKIVYALFKPVRANVILDTVRKSNEIFGGFINGKILDSAIIGVLAYIVLVIMRMPDPVLLAVIIGVTNVIPFFGPFIGAIPSFIIVVLQNPVQGIYFLIFILILQQIDGNIIGPKILGNSTGLSSFWVVFAIIVFGGLWGFLGMLLGVPLMAVIYYIIQSIVSYQLEKRGIPGSKIDYVKLERISKETNQPEYLKEKEEIQRPKKPRPEKKGREGKQ